MQDVKKGKRQDVGKGNVQDVKKESRQDVELGLPLLKCIQGHSYRSTAVISGG